jgi:glycosyltransferase involved in cell wall biosynthesis/GT2 family glycosyltransferase
LKRVILVTPDIVGPVRNGGIGTACLHIARMLVGAGYAVELLFAGWELGEGELEHWRAVYTDMGIVFHALDNTPSLQEPSFGLRWYTEASIRIMEWLKQRTADVILFQDWKAEGFWTVRAKQMGLAFADVQIGVIAHGSTAWQNAGMKTFGSDVLYQDDMSACEQAAIAGADILISPSRHMVQWMTEEGFDLPSRVEICPIAFEGPVGARCDRPVDFGHVIFFGRLETRKGLELLGEAMRRTKRTGGALPRKLSLVGKHGAVEHGSVSAYIDRLRRDLPEVECAVMADLDHRQAIDYIETANGVVVIPSLLDNFPMTVLESIEHGFPLLAADVGGIPEMLDPGALFAPTVEGLSDKLESLSSIRFADFRHPYSASVARGRWLSTLEALCRPTSPKRTRGLPPPISVCIPFYRHDGYIRRTVSAFLAMDLPELQIVVVDDGTPAGERMELDRLRPELERAGHRVLWQPNAGPGAARNAAIAAATHDLLLFFDADNVPLPDMVTKLWTALDGAGAHSVSAPFLAIPPMQRMPNREDVIWRYQPGGILSALTLFENTLGDMTALIRRDVVEEVGRFCTDLSRPGWEDWELFLRIIGRGFRHMVYPDPLLFYTDHPGREKSPSHLYDVRSSLIRQIDQLDSKVVTQLAKVLVGHGYVLRDAGAW